MKARPVAQLKTRASAVMARLPQAVQRELRELPPDDAVYHLNEFYKLSVSARRTRRFMTFVQYIGWATVAAAVLHSLLQ